MMSMIDDAVSFLFFHTPKNMRPRRLRLSGVRMDQSSIAKKQAKDKRYPSSKVNFRRYGVRRTTNRRKKPLQITTISELAGYLGTNGPGLGKKEQELRQ
jgi:hypothetical protein